MALNFQTSGLNEIARQHGFEVRIKSGEVWVNFYVLGARASRRFSDRKGEGQQALEIYVERWIRDHGPKVQKLNQECARSS